MCNGKFYINLWISEYEAAGGAVSIYKDRIN